MCDVASAVMVGVALAGAGMQYQGQRKAAKEAKRTMARALNEQESLRKKALKNSEDVVKGQGAEALTKESGKPQQIVDQEAMAGDAIAEAFAKGTGTDSSNQGRIHGAVRGVKRTATNEARGAGFSRALQANLARLGGLTTDNLLLASDSRQINDRLPYQLDRAGAAGADMRLLGQLAMSGSQAGMSNQAWQRRPATSSTTGMAV